MYLEHFGLGRRPFAPGPDPAMLLLTERHREALVRLLYAAGEGKRLMVFTGPAGVGKSVLLARAAADLRSGGATVALVPAAGRGVGALDRQVRAALGLRGEGALRAENYAPLRERPGERIALFLDGAEGLSEAALAEVERIAGLDSDGAAAVTVVLSGREPLAEKAAALRTRLDLGHRLEPLDRAETGHYVAHRLRVAGRAEPVFAPEALDEVHEASRGRPGAINAVADLSLLAAFQRRAVEVIPAHVREVVAEMEAWTGRAGA